MSTPQSRTRLIEILSEAYSDLDPEEVRRLLTEAQERKRRGTGYLLVRPDNGQRLEIEPLEVASAPSTRGT